MKKIALDIDGVIFDSENLFRVYSEIYDVDVKKNDNVIDNSIRLFQKRYRWNSSDINDFYSTYTPIVLTNSNIMSGADIVIPKLSKNFEFILVTARTNDEIKKIRNDVLDKLGLTGVKIFNEDRNKIDTFLKENVDYIIDDSEVVCSEASKRGITSLYFKNNAANKLQENEYLKNVNNWGEIYKYIMMNERI